MPAAFLALKKLIGAGMVLTAARHNLREIQVELGGDGHIDTTRSHLNLLLAGPAGAIAVSASAEAAMRDAGIFKPRRDAVRAVEIVVALPIGIAIEPKEFFINALQWVRVFYPVPVLSAVVHLDESAPHLHVLLLPLVGGRMKGSDLVGNAKQLRSAQSSFYDKVARQYGLARPVSEKRLNGAARNKVAKQIVRCLKSFPHRLESPDVRTALVEAIASNPARLAAALGLRVLLDDADLPEFSPVNTQILGKTDANPNPIGFQAPRTSGAGPNPISV